MRVLPIVFCLYGSTLFAQDTQTWAQVTASPSSAAPSSSAPPPPEPPIVVAGPRVHDAVVACHADLRARIVVVYDETGRLLEVVEHVERFEVAYASTAQLVCLRGALSATFIRNPNGSRIAMNLFPEARTAEARAAGERAARARAEREREAARRHNGGVEQTINDTPPRVTAGATESAGSGSGTFDSSGNATVSVTMRPRGELDLSGVRIDTHRAIEAAMRPMDHDAGSFVHH